MRLFFSSRKSTVHGNRNFLDMALVKRVASTNSFIFLINKKKSEKMRSDDSYFQSMPRKMFENVKRLYFLELLKTNEKNNMNKVYEIKPPKSGKDKIKHPKLSEAGVIPKLGASILLIGVTKSGKSVLLYNLLDNKEFFGGAFDKLFYISPSGDDTLEGLEIEDEAKFTDLKKAAQALTVLQ